MAVVARRRFKRTFPCPICNGYDEAERGTAQRCFGFLSDDGIFAHCTREEHGGSLSVNLKSATYPHRLKGNCPCGVRHDPNPENRRTKSVAKIYPYHDEQGRVLFECVRYSPKGFKQRRPDGRGGYIWNLNDVRKVPYRLLQLIQANNAQLVYVAEGEKDADRLLALGLVATCNPMGAGKWPRATEFNCHFQGRHCVVIPDNDDAGRKHGEKVAASLHGVAASVKILELPDLPPKGDVSDWLDLGGTAEELRRLASEAPCWTPSALDRADDSDMRLRIDAGEKDFPIITGQAWDAIRKRNEQNPILFRHGGVITRLEPDDDGAIVLRELTTDKLRHELARSALFFTIQTRNGESVESTVKPPVDVVLDMQATRNPPLPVLHRVTETPVFAPDGVLETTPGYHEASRTYYFPADGFDLPDVPATPTVEDVEQARALILEDALADFLFASDADRANAVALALLPFVRDLVTGPTPNHLIEAPAAGSGKGLLADVLLRPASGRHVGVVAEARDDDEWRKRITARLYEARSVILIDNVTRPINSGVLAAALTASVWEDRVLGRSETVRVPVRCVWVTTANNPVMSTEIARRCVRIRLDPKVDRPWLRDGFRHPDLRGWIDDHRGEMVWALLVLAQAWLSAGRPRPSVKPLGSFESWSYVLGGILETAGIGGFLANLNDFYEVADLEGTVWRAFVAAWWERFGNRTIGTSELFPLAQETEGFDVDGKTPRAQQIRFGVQLAKQRDRVIGEYRIIAAGKAQRASQWRLQQVRDLFTTGSDDEKVNVVNVSECFPPMLTRESHVTSPMIVRGDGVKNIHQHSQHSLTDPDITLNGHHASDHVDDDSFDEETF